MVKQRTLTHTRAHSHDGIVTFVCLSASELFAIFVEVFMKSKSATDYTQKSHTSERKSEQSEKERKKKNFTIYYFI